MNFLKKNDLINFENNGLKLIFKEKITDFDKRFYFYKQNNKPLINVYNTDTENKDLFSVLSRLKELISENNLFFNKLETPLNIKLWKNNVTFLGNEINDTELLIINYFDNYVLFYVITHNLFFNDVDDIKLKISLIKELDNTKLYLNIGATDLLILDLKNKKLAGCALTTDLNFRPLGDVIIAKKYQKQGLFKLIIKELLTKYPEVRTTRIDGPFEPFLKTGFKLLIKNPNLELKVYTNLYGYKHWSYVQTSYINKEMFNKKGYFEIILNNKLTNEQLNKIKNFLKKEFDADTKFLIT